MQSALASTSDLATFMKVAFDEAATEQAELVLQLASAWARSIAHKLWAEPEDIAEFRRDTVIGIILASARRELTNPRRVTYEVHGPDSASYNQKAVPAGFFTDEEEKYLRACRGSSGSMWTVETYRDEEATSEGYLHSATTAKPFPMYAPYDTEGWQNSYHL